MIFGLSQEQVEKRLDRGQIMIAVYGLGRVGLPLAVAWLRAGQRVIGADINPEVVEKINKAISPIMDEPHIPEAVEKFVNEGKFQATTDLVKASDESDIKLIAVPTMLTKEKKFDGRALENALRGIGRGLKKGDAVSIECSVPPTTTENWAKPILEKESGLKAERDFAFVFSPERIYESRALEDLEERYPKIVGGVGPRSTKLFSILYSRVAKKGVLEMGSATTAELSKLFEGIYRDVNIALANELAGLCQILNVDFMEVSAASNSQPYCHLHKPGVGVGGVCLPVYPYFILEKAGERDLTMPLTRLGRMINEEMPKNVVNLIKKTLEKVGVPIQGTRVAILGLAFRGNVADARNSPTYELATLLRSLGTEVVVHEPYIKKDKRLEELKIPLLKSLEEAVKDASLILIATDHKEYAQIEFTELVKFTKAPTILFDGRGITDAARIPKDIYFTGIGRSINNL